MLETVARPVKKYLTGNTLAALSDTSKTAEYHFLHSPVGVLVARLLYPAFGLACPAETSGTSVAACGVKVSDWVLAIIVSLTTRMNDFGPVKKWFSKGRVELCMCYVRSTLVRSAPRVLDLVRWSLVTALLAIAPSS